MMKLIVLALFCACALGQLSPPELGCAFHVQKKEYDDSGRVNIITDYYGLMNDEGSFLKVAAKGGPTTLVRCDITNDDDECYVKVNNVGSDPSCTYGDIADYMFELEEFEYDEGPEGCDCPDGKTDCSKYCDTSSDACLIVDDEDRFVQYLEEDVPVWLFVYKDDTPTVDTFADTMCTGENMPDFDDPCGDTPPSSNTIYPKLPDCAFHFTYTVDESIRKKRNIKKAARGDDDAEVYGVIFNGEPYFLKTVSGDDTIDLLRCDIKDNEENCYYSNYAGYDCSPEYLPAAQFSWHYPDPTMGFEFDGDLYPADADCPRGSSSTGCEKYCIDSDEDECVIVDSLGRFVQNEYGEVFIFHDAPAMTEFEDANCADPLNPLPSPVNPCKDDSSSHPGGDSSHTTTGSSSSSNPTGGDSSNPSATPSGTPAAPSSTPTQPSTNPSPSSASVTRVAFAVVAAVLLVALL